MDSLIQSAAGAVIGFALAQVVNVAKVIINFLYAPKLRIKTTQNCRLLDHHVEQGLGQRRHEIEFGFDVLNIGRRVATDVKCQLLKIEYQKRGENFRTAVDQTFPLFQYSSANNRSEAIMVTLIPKASATFHLASYQEDRHVIWPEIRQPLDYYEEACEGAISYWFTVVVFDKQNRFVTKVLTIDA